MPLIHRAAAVLVLAEASMPAKTTDACLRGPDGTVAAGRGIRRG